MNTSLSSALQKSLADTFVMYSKVHSFHWNVTGPRFLELHTFFEEIYTSLWNTLDVIAEEIRMMGTIAPKNIAELSAGSSIVSANSVPTATEMIASIIADFDTLMQSYKNTAEVADDADEEGIEGVLFQLVADYKKMQWKLKSMQ
jgi:starvation-inducible DNA-binding protein